jgi:hypothetical protein
MTKHHEFNAQATGKPVKISAAAFDSALELHDAIFAEGAGLDLKLSLDTLRAGNVKEMAVADIVPKIVPFIMGAMASKRIKAALFACLEKSTYDNEKITMKTFEDYDARAAFYEIAAECLKFNLAPFFSGARFVLSPLAALMKKDSPAQK